MSFTAIENNPIQVNLLTAANDTGWVLPGDNTAVHSTCNSGFITLTTYSIISGHSYTISYTINSVNTGYVQCFLGNTGGIQHISSGIITEFITATNNDPVKFFSNANCSIQSFNIIDTTTDDSLTIVYSNINKKWSDFRTIFPDFGWSLFENTITAFKGQIFLHLNGSDNTNNFFGVPYQSSIKVVFSNNPEIINNFDVLSYQSNMLLVSTQGGITTSTGQQTTLIDDDFKKTVLSDGVTSVTVFQNQNVYSASLLNDEFSDVINGEPMQGNFIIVELQTVDGSTPLKLFSMAMKTARKWIGNR